MDFDIERKYLEVKQKLDSLHLPTVFPVEVIPLLSNLLNLVGNKKEDRPKQESVNPDSNKLRAVTHELQKTTKQNNTLHLEIMHLKQQNQILRKRISKLELTRQSSGHQEIMTMHQQHQKQLKEELKRVTKKYQDLLQRAYNKENGFDNIPVEYQEENKMRQFNMAMPEKKFMEIETKEPQKENYKKKEQNAQQTHQLQQKCQFLQQKIQNREKQILRLQQKVEFDGLNMNKLLKDFEKHDHSSRQEFLNHQIDLLNKENHKLKEEMRKIRSNAGHAEVLRKDIEKNKEKQRLKNTQHQKQLKQSKEREFHLTTQVNKLKIQNKELIKQLSIKIQELQHHQKNKEDLINSTNFYQREAGEEKQRHRQIKQKNMQIELNIQQVRAQVEGQKIFLSYELEDAKKKLQEAETAYREQQQTTQATQNRMIKLEQLIKLSEEQHRVKDQTIINLEEIVRELQLKLAETKVLTGQFGGNNGSGTKANANHSQHSSHGNQSSNRHYEELSASNQVLSSQKTILERDIRQLKQLNDELQERLESTHQSFSKKIEHLRQQNDQLKQDIAQLQLELDNSRTAIISVNKSKEIVDFQLRKLKSEMQSLEENLSEARKMESTNDKLKQHSKKAENNNQILTMRVASLEQQKQQLNRQIEIAENKLKTAKQNEKKLKEDKKQLQETLSDLESTTNRLQHERQKANQKLSELQNTQNQLVKQLKLRQQAAIELEQEITKCKKQKIKIQKKFQELQKQKIQLQQRVPILNNEQVFFYKKELSNMIQKIDRYMTINRQLNELVAITKKQNEQLTTQINGFKKEVDHLRYNINIMQGQRRQATQNQQNLLQKIQDLQITIQNMGEHDPMKEKLHKIELVDQRQMKESREVFKR